MIYHIAETTSTNDLAREERYGHGDVICAERQTAGRGQRGHTWTSPEGVNLLFSVVLCPTFLPAGEQFPALAGRGARAGRHPRHLRKSTPASNGRTTSTPEIANWRVSSSSITSQTGGSPHGGGIGINVQPDGVRSRAAPIPPRWRSKRDTRSTEGRCSTGSTPHSCDGMPRSKRADRAPLAEEYRRRMYRIDAPQAFRLPDGTRFTGVIRGVRAGGALQVEHPRRHVARLSFQGDRVRGEKIAGGVGNEKIRRIFVSPALQAAGIRDADHPAGQKAGTARPVQPRNGLRDRTTATETDSSMQKR